MTEFPEYPKGPKSDALTENADHCERQLSHPNRSPDWIVLPKNLVASCAVTRQTCCAFPYPRIEKAPAQYDKPPNRLITLRHSNQIHGALHAAGNHVHGQFAGSRYFNYIGNGLGGFHVSSVFHS